MSHSFRTRGLIAVLAAIVLVFAGRGALMAADDKPDVKKADAKDSDATTAKANPFAVPDDKPDVVLKFIQTTEKARPTQIKSQEELIKFITDSRKAIVKAVDKILGDKASDKTRLSAIKSKLNALMLLEQVGDPDAAKQLKDSLGQLKDDKQPEVARLVKGFEIRQRMSEAASDPAAATKLWDDIKVELKAAPDDKDMFMLAGSFASSLERVKPELAGQALNELSEMASKSKEPAIAELAKKFEGIARRLTLMGKPIEIKGTLLDGSPFDPGTLKGKVVLVDFWATWCGPCRGELPNVKQNYEKYHDKGFEVVGVSLDQSLDDLEKFIADEKIAWPILFPKEKKDQFWNNPLAVYYGVNAIPCAILTNQKGEVVSLNARGPVLTDKLAELLGPADDKAKDADKPKDAAK
jgi:thiol-disulfide isomerase/thioredoxin